MPGQADPTELVLSYSEHVLALLGLAPIDYIGSIYRVPGLEVLGVIILALIVAINIQVVEY